MRSPSQQLTEDHEALDKLLAQLQTALNKGEVAASHSSLDLFWARLAVHIRAEHLHLFPDVMFRVGENAGKDGSPSVREAQLTVEQLRADHDFFMHELAAAIAVLRDPRADDDIQSVSRSVANVQKRLITHNEIEEGRIYQWVSNLFDEREQMELAARINRELRNHPPRFSETLRW